MALQIIYHLLCYVLYFHHVCSGESGESGTLIVTYQTTKEGERLDRIRFWIKGDNYKQWLYPKGKSYFDDELTKTRKVVIEKLPEGKYTLEFLIPNTDGFFCEVPNRQVTITSGSVVRINQVIRAEGEASAQPQILAYETSPTPSGNPGSLIVSFDADKGSELLDKIRFSVSDAFGKKRIFPQDARVINTPGSGGRIVVISDLPGGDYSIEFFEDGSGPLAKQKVHVKENTTTTIYESFASKETKI